MKSPEGHVITTSATANRTLTPPQGHDPADEVAIQKPKGEFCQVLQGSIGVQEFIVS